MRLVWRLLLVGGLWGVATMAYALLDIEITEGGVGGIPIAVVPFQRVNVSGPLPARVAAIVDSDLERSGLFFAVPASQYPERTTDSLAVDTRPWRDAGIEAVVVGTVEQTAADAYAVSFRLYDTLAGQQLLGYRIPAPGNSLRKVAHKISDLVFEELTGIPGVFSTRIAYVGARDTPSGTRRYHLQVADSDGFDPQTIYSADSPIMSPAWSPDGRRIAYVSFESGRPEVFVQEVATGQRHKVSGRPGINSAPAWSPDGLRLALVLSVDGGPQVYLLDTIGGRLQRLTFGAGINTEPAWMPDGKSLIFTSDRSGSPQLYRIPASGGSATRLTFEGRYNASPVVSPDGRQLALVHGTGSGFRIGLLDLQTRSLRVVTDGSLDESPSFAPNGSMLIYATEHGGRGVLAAVSEDGRIKQRLSEGSGDVREPAWAPAER